MSSFAPTYSDVAKRGQYLRRTVKPLVCNYVFLRGNKEQIYSFSRQYPQYSPIYNSAEDRTFPVIIPDGEMDNFIRLANAYQNNLPCYAPGEIDLIKGDRVKIIGGPFEGIIGILKSQRGTDGGRVIVNVANLLAAHTLEIAPKYIQVLQFAPGTKRLYDVLDAFLPRLEKAVGEMKICGELSQQSVASMNYFVSRFSELEVKEVKMRAKHALLLFSALHLILPPQPAVPALNASPLESLYHNLSLQCSYNLSKITNIKTRERLIPLLPQSPIQKI